MDLGLRGKRVLVTGSHRGTGAVIARRFADEGAHVVVHGFELAAADAVAAEISSADGRCEAVAGDIMTDDGANAVAEAASADGPIDVLVNNYGIAAGPSWSEGTTADWIEGYEHNVLSAVRMAQALVGPMRDRGWGRVINLGTVGSLRPGPRTPHYYAAKTALPSVTLTLAKELAGTGVTVNTVSPGVIATQEVIAYFMARAERKGWDGSTWEEIAPQAAASFMPNPCGRFATTDEVADTVLFVASERAGYVNAVNLRVDGGAADCVA